MNLLVRTELSNVKVIYLIVFTLLILFISCDDNKPTEQVDLGTLVGDVYQLSRGLTYFIPNAKVNVDGYVTYSDSAGRYEIDVPEGPHSITCSFDEYDTTYISRVLVTDTRAYNLRMTGPTYTVSGTVTDTIGSVVDGAIVQLEHLVDTSDANGYFSFDSIPRGEWQFSIIKDDYIYAIDSVQVTDTDYTNMFELSRLDFTVRGTTAHLLVGLLADIIVILDDTLYDTTNSNGEFMFEHVYIGLHKLEFISDYYNSKTEVFNLGLEDFNINVVLKKLFIDTLYLVSEDALVKINYSSIDGYTYQDDNFGNDSINLLYHSMSEYLYWDPYIGQYRETSFSTSKYFIKLAGNILSLGDSAVLVIPFEKPSYLRFGEIRFYSVAEDWDESTITSNNQPTVNTGLSDFVDLELDSFNNKIMYNITSQIPLFTNPYGFRISYKNEHCYFCDQGLYIYSTEYSDSTKHPHFLVYRSD